MFDKKPCGKDRFHERDHARKRLLNPKPSSQDQLRCPLTVSDSSTNLAPNVQKISGSRSMAISKSHSWEHCPHFDGRRQAFASGTSTSVRCARRPRKLGRISSRWFATTWPSRPQNDTRGKRKAERLARNAEPGMDRRIRVVLDHEEMVDLVFLSFTHV